MQSKWPAAILWRLLSVNDRRRLMTTRPGSRKLKHMLVLVEVRCASAQPRPHELAYVYKLPGDVIPKMQQRDAQAVSKLYGDLLFVSTDNERFTTGESWTLVDGERVDNSDLMIKKQRTRGHNEAIQPNRLRIPAGQRRWAPLVDLLDYEVDDDDLHADLVTRCRCGSRPAADRRQLMDAARAALGDGQTRRVFL
jgi:hypothetical protein